MNSFRKKLSKNSILVAIFSIFLLSFFNFAQTLALEGAKWGGSDKNSIIYNGKTFQKATEEQKKRLPQEAQNGTAFVNFSNADPNSQQTAEAIVVNSTNSDKIEGKFYNFNVSALNNLQQQGNSQNISGQGTAENSDKKEGTSCIIEGGGGWVVCSAANTIANAMDGLYDILKGFLITPPPKTTEKSGLFVAWDYMRNIANVIFVIIFMLVIYSQITNVGISNYGIKKLLPKLIVAAILINISYYICAIGVDLSNIFGGQLQDILNEIRKGIVAQGFEVEMSWAKLTAAILAGAGIAGFSAVNSGALGSWQALGFAILGVLLTVVFAIFISIVVLAARQAIITVAIFVSPLAFAANVLPNTEKWFEKWKDLFVSILIMYPLMSLLFGGSQLAGTIIIENSNGNIATLILGMTVQIVPLAITPVLMKISTGLLGRFAGMVNNPNRGIVDTSRKFINEGKADALNKQIASGKGLTAALHGAKYNRKRRYDFNASRASKMQENRAIEREVQDIERAQKMADGETRERILSKNVIFQQELLDNQTAAIKKASESAISGIKADLIRNPLQVDLHGNIVGIDSEKVSKMAKNLGTSSAKLYETLNSANAHSLAAQNNNAMITNSIAETFKRERKLQDISEGRRGEAGRNVALAQAFATAKKTNDDERNAITSIFKSFDLTGDQLKDIVHHKNDSFTSNDGVTFKNNDTLKSAVMDEFMKKTSSIVAAETVGMTAAGGILHDIRSSVSEAFAANKKNDFQWAGGGMLGDIASKGLTKDEFWQGLEKGFASKGSDKGIISADADVLREIFKNLNQPNASSSTIEATLRSFVNINSDPSKYGELKANQGDVIMSAIKDISNAHPNEFSKIQAKLLEEMRTKDPNASLDWNLPNIKRS